MSETIWINLSSGEDLIPSRLEYIVTYLNRHPVKPNGICINLRFNDSIPKGCCYLGFREIQIQHPFLLGVFKKDPKDSASWSMSKYTFRQRNILGITKRQSGGVAMEHNTLQFDLLGNLFFHLSRYEEVFWQGKQAIHGGMPESEHLLVRAKAHTLPVVDQLVLFFFSLFDLPSKITPTEIRLTHDIDAIWKYPSLPKTGRTLGRVLLNQPHRLIAHLYQWARVWQKQIPDPFDTFDWLFSSAVIQKEVYWIVGGATQYEGFYSIYDPKVMALIELAKARGYNVGLHPSYDSAATERVFTREVETFKSVMGFEPSISRQHFLRWDHKKTPYFIEQASIQQDGTMGFNEYIGFRAGTGFSFQLYCFEEERPYRFSSFPMVVMDTALLHRYGAKAFTYLQSFLEQNRSGTCITLNVHNFTFDSLREGGSWAQQDYAFYF